MVAREDKKRGASKVWLQGLRYKPDLHRKRFDASERAERFRLRIDDGEKARLKLAVKRRDKRGGVGIIH
jgi:hypothetical protein